MESMWESLVLFYRNVALLANPEDFDPGLHLTFRTTILIAVVSIVGTLLFLFKDLFGKGSSGRKAAQMPQESMAERFKMHTEKFKQAMQKIPWRLQKKTALAFEEEDDMHVPPSVQVLEPHREIEFKLLKIRAEFNDQPLVQTVKDVPTVVNLGPAIFRAFPEQTPVGSNLRVFDDLVNTFADRFKKRIVLADFQDENANTSTLHQYLVDQTKLSLIICREMAWNVDLIPHCAILPIREQKGYNPATIKDFFEKLTAEYDEIVVFDQPKQMKKWAHLFDLAGLRLQNSNWKLEASAAQPAGPLKTVFSAQKQKSRTDRKSLKEL